jgi:hypothetical protein
MTPSSFRKSGHKSLGIVSLFSFHARSNSFHPENKTPFKSSKKRNPERPVVVLESDDKGKNLSGRGNLQGDDTRSPPPHIHHFGEVIREGSLEAKSNILVGARALITSTITLYTHYWVPDVEPVNEHLPVDTLAHGLDRVLFKYVVQL